MIYKIKNFIKIKIIIIKSFNSFRYINLYIKYLTNQLSLILKLIQFINYIYIYVHSQVYIYIYNIEYYIQYDTKKIIINNKFSIFYFKYLFFLKIII